MNVRYVCIFLFVCFAKTNSQFKNVCPTYQDYYTIRTNPNCWHDFTIDANVTDIITKFGYPLETYKITTPDGYILQVFRIPNPNSAKNGVVYFQHGLGATSADFFGRRNESIGFLLFNAGYDVWFGNYRGNEYSDEHVRLNVLDPEYWNFSMDELSIQDTPLIIDFIAEKTGRKGNITFIGHSLGTTTAVQYSAGMSDHAKENINFMILLAPTVTLPHMISPLKHVGPFGTQLLDFVTKNELVSYVSRVKAQRGLIKELCRSSPTILKLCMDSINLGYGPHTQMSPDRVPYFFSHWPAGTSIKIVKQCGDLILDKFTRFDYGNKNYKIYGTKKPPIYDVSKMKVPIFMLSAKNDWLCTAKDAINWYNRLPPEIQYGMEVLKIPDFNHIDFLFGKDVKSLVYDKVLLIIDKINNNVK